MLDLLTSAVTDKNPIIRKGVAEGARIMTPEQQMTLLAPLLTDALASVRISTAQSLLPSWQQLPAPFQARMAPVLAEYRAYLQQEADTSWARRLLGELHEHLGESELALAAYRDCLEFDPYHVPAVEKLVEFYERKGRLQTALDTLKAAVTLQPRNSRLHHLLSRMHLKLGDTKQALHHAREASIHAPTDSELREGYATLLVQHAPDAVQTIFQRGRDRALMATLCQKLPKTRQPAACQP